MSRLWDALFLFGILLGFYERGPFDERDDWEIIEDDIRSSIGDFSPLWREYAED